MIYESTKNCSYALGMSISIELLEKHAEYVKKVVYSKKIKQNEYFKRLNELCRINRIELKEDDALIKKLSVKENCYVIAFFSKFSLPFTSKKIILIDRLEDMGMLGTILRTAVSFRHYDIALLNSDIDIFDPRVVRSSMGAIFYCHIQKYQDLEAFLKDYPKIPIFNIKKDGQRKIEELEKGEEYALLFNSKEEKGESFYIDTNGIELPLSVKAAIVLQSLY